MTIRVHVVISGKVQGVFYRASTKEKADTLGITGWVKNMPGGKVEAVFQGDEQQVQKMIEWCWNGPPQSQVIDIKVRREPLSDNFFSFNIRYGK